MKKCTQCKTPKEMGQFNKNARRNDGRQTMCRDCTKINNKKYNKKNPKQRKQSKIAQAVRVQLCQEYILNVFQDGCTDCGETNPVVLEFDHVLEGKTDNVSYIMRLGTLSRLVDEIKLCEVVCANCHRIRTCERSGCWRTDL